MSAIPRSITVAFALGVVLLGASSARADRREWYLVPTVAPELMRLVQPTSDVGRVTKPTVGFGLSAFYGLTNSLHVGAEVHLASLRNISFEGATFLLGDGSTPSGALYADEGVYSLTATALYRLVLPTDFAPLVGVGAGPVLARYSSLALYPSGTQFTLARPDSSELGFAARALVGLDYRLGNHLSASLAFEVRRDFGTHVPWEFGVPVSVAYIW
jgi:opacity protein-like surface antigen